MSLSVLSRALFRRGLSTGVPSGSQAGAPPSFSPARSQRLVDSDNARKQNIGVFVLFAATVWPLEYYLTA